MVTTRNRSRLQAMSGTDGSEGASISLSESQLSQLVEQAVASAGRSIVEQFAQLQLPAAARHTTSPSLPKDAVVLPIFDGAKHGDHRASLALVAETVTAIDNILTRTVVVLLTRAYA